MFLLEVSMILSQYINDLTMVSKGTPRKLTCPLKRDHFILKGNLLSSNHQCSGDMLVFKGVLGKSLVVYLVPLAPLHLVSLFQCNSLKSLKVKPLVPGT